MPDKDSKKKPEIPQPRPDIILPDDSNAANVADADHEVSQQRQCQNQEEL